ncbi:MAG: response regulator, partial [Maricaulaceae bacterium]
MGRMDREANNASRGEAPSRKLGASAASENRDYDALYAYSPIALLENDFSAAAELVARFSAEGVTDVAAWIAENPMALIANNRGSRVVNANAAALKLFGIDHYDALNKNKTWFFKLEYMTCYAEYVLNVARGELSYEGECRLYGAGRRPIDVLLSARPLPGHETDLARVVCSIVDISERKRFEADLAKAKEGAEAANHAKSLFLASISHEIRTPLNAVLGLTNVLQREVSTQAHADHLDVIEESGRRLLTLLDDVVDLARISSGDVPVEIETIDLNGFARELDGAWRSRFDAAGLSFALDDDWAGAGAACFDVRLARQIAHQFLSNACKFTERGGAVLQLRMVTGNAPGRARLRIAVEDTGPGLDPVELPRLWDRFVTGAPTASDASVTPGAGLGLAIVREIADLVGGACGAEPGAAGGARFWADIPCELAAEIGQGVAGNDLLPAGLRVLAAEDNPINRRVLGAVLEAFGVNATLVENGAEAVEALQLADYDIVLMDIAMPVMDGVTAAGRIRALPGAVSQTPIVAVTANCVRGDRARYLNAGIDDVVPKPIDPAVLGQ